MPRMPTESLRPGWYLASHIYSAAGLLLLAPGTRLRPSHIVRLKELGVRSMDVTIGHPGTPPTAEIVSPPLRAAAVAAAWRAFEQCRRGQFLSADSLARHARALVREIFRNWGAPAGLSDVRTEESCIPAHSVNVCVLSVVIGKLLGLTRRSLEELALGAILHDLGKARLHPGLPGINSVRLTAYGQEPAQEHTRAGFEIVRVCPNVGTASAFVALQHHERLDGSGYPTGVKARLIGIYARIAAVADLHDVLSSDWPHMGALTPGDSLLYLQQLSPDQLWAEAVDALAEIVGPFHDEARMARD